MNFTEKLFYLYPNEHQCTAKVIAVTENAIILDKTIAYPEGGGQEADHGVIRFNNDKELIFLDVQKGAGRSIYIKDFPVIQVENKISHIISNDFIGELDQSLVGEQVTVEIDHTRREKLSISHSASHLLYVAVKRVRPDVINSIKGCHIKEGAARFDFRTSERFTEEQIAEISTLTQQLVEQNEKIKVFQHPDENEAWYWECFNEVIPCGGTHIQRTGEVGRTQIKRKRIGKGLERLSVLLG